MIRKAKSILGLFLAAALGFGVSTTSRAEPGAAEGGGGEGSAATAVASGVPLDDAALERILQSGYVEVEKVRLVLLPTTVEDKKGRIVRNLAREDFTLREDHIPQTIQFFTSETATPVSIAFMLDVSGSMRMSGKLEAAKEAIRYFVDALRPQDRFALICFADEQVAWVTEFTSDRDLFLLRLAVQIGYGQTALHDAVAAAPGLVQASGDGKKAIVLITDGVDNASVITLEEAAETAKRASVPIYTVGFSSLPPGLVPEQRELRTNFEVLGLFSEETGGTAYAVHDPDELKEAVARIDEELRFQYLIGYKPTRSLWNGRYRSIELETRKNRYVVSTRKGYYATP